MAGDIFIGTSGWSYAHWRGGVFYPKDLPPSKQFEYYCQHFNTVEINSSFYRLPKLEYLKRWQKAAPQDFRFAAKLNRTITHYAKLRDCSERLYENKVLKEGLADKLSVILVQLPPSLKFDIKLLEGFLELTKSEHGSWLPKLAFEFRDTSWINKNTYDLLTKYSAAICLSDWQGCQVEDANDVDFVYIRRHGPSGRYRGCYTKKHLENDAKLIKRFLKEEKQLYIYFNNDIEGYAVKNAKELKQLLKL